MSFLTDSSLIGGFLRAPYFHVKRLFCERNYRTVALLKTIHGPGRRYREKRIRAFGVFYRVPDVASFLSMLDEIYVNRIYEFPTVNDAPLIVDIGANIGVSVNYFMSRYPHARIVAYEADPAVFACLQQNVSVHGDRVTLINQAVWVENTRLPFVQEGADGGRLAGDGGIDVQAVDIRNVLADKRIDLLKIDIEGAEESVLPACAGMLDNVERIFLEYHSRPDRHQRFGEIADMLNAAGFRLHVQTVSGSRAPFSRVKLNGGFDMQLNIFAWRETSSSAE
jgi:FkbM family methyltransferase